jgi:hypothetical protein
MDDDERRWTIRPSALCRSVPGVPVPGYTESAKDCVQKIAVILRKAPRKPSSRSTSCAPTEESLSETGAFAPKQT